MEDNEIPEESVTRELIDHFHQRWTNESVTMNSVMQLTCDRLDVPIDDFSWDTFFEKHSREVAVTQILHQLIKKYDELEQGEVMQKFQQAATVVFNLHDLLKQVARTVCNMQPDAVTTRRMLPEPLRTPETLEMYNDHMLRHDQKHNTNWQNAFFFLREQLESLKYLRAGDSFFKKVRLNICGDNIESLAYEAATTIENFLEEHAGYGTSLHAWRWLTNPTANFDIMCKFLTNNRLMEAPDMEVDLRFRSYQGDEFGNGAGVYDSLEDVFYPYICPTSEWLDFAGGIMAMRRILFQKPEYTLDPPTSKTVCVVHLHTAFPYSTHHEVKGTPGRRDVPALLSNLPEKWTWPLATRVPVGAQWREAHAFECDTYRSRCIPDSAELGQLLAQLFDAFEGEKHPYGISWHVETVEGSSIDKLRLIEDSELRTYILDVQERNAEQQLWGDSLEKFEKSIPSYEEGGIYGIHLRDASYAIFVRQPTRQPRILLTPTQWKEQVSKHTIIQTYSAQRNGETVQVPTDPRDLYVKHGTRFFMLDLGRTAFDCDALEIDQIFECQDFTPHDRHHCYAYIGRLFFRVGQLDHHEGTLFFLGVGGCGKSTILNAIKPFWPRHLIATLSSNMQAQFGMASLADGEVVICSEVSEELNLPQEEWQDATGGATLSLARKFKDPLIVPNWKSQFVWAGNQFPKRWKNAQMQVSRRLAGVLMKHPVKGRDGTIAKRLVKKQGSLQRKFILAYHTFLHANGNTDPMSRPDKLPPAFQAFMKEGRESTNPMLAFINEGTFVRPQRGAKMLLDDFRGLYNEWRTKYDMGRSTRWSEDLYASAFSDHDMNIFHNSHYEKDGELIANAIIITNVCNLREEAAVQELEE